MREGENDIKFLLMEKEEEEVVRAKISFGGNRCHVGFFISFIRTHD